MFGEELFPKEKQEVCQIKQIATHKKNRLRESA